MKNSASSAPKSTRRLTLSPHHLVALSLFVLALIVRCLGLRWGLPSAEHWYSYHPDESPHQIVGAVARLLQGGGWNPHFFNYPSLGIYFTYFVYLLLGAAGWAAPPAAAPWPLLHDIVLAGRLVSALLGAATVPIVYAIGHQIGGARVGICAGLLMALLPGHVQHSHFATVDVPATFFVALALWLAVRALQASDEANTARRHLLLAACAAGLAAATKYNAGLVLIAPLTALFCLRQFDAWKGGAGKTVALMLGVAALGFLLGCPYSVLSPGEFWGDGLRGGQNGFAYELLVHPRQGSGSIFSATGNGWWYHLTFNLPFALTWPILAAAIGGVIFALRSKGSVAAVQSAQVARTRFFRLALPLIVWSLAYFLSLGFSQVRFMRYTLPLMPALVVFAAWVASTPSTRRFSSKIRTIIAAALSGLLCLSALWGTANVIRPFISTDPRDQVVAFFKAAPSSETVTIGLVEAPWFFTPPFVPRNRDLGALTTSPDGRFRLNVIGLDATRLAREKPPWVVLSEFEWREQARLGDAAYLKFMEQLKRDYTLHQVFANPPLLNWPGRAFVPHDFLYSNPSVRLYKRGQQRPEPR